RLRSRMHARRPRPPSRQRIDPSARMGALFQGLPHPTTLRAFPGDRFRIRPPASSCAPPRGQRVCLGAPRSNAPHHEAPAELPRTPLEGAAADRDSPPMEYPMKKSLPLIVSVFALAMAAGLVSAATTNSATPATPAKKATAATPAAHGT